MTGISASVIARFPQPSGDRALSIEPDTSYYSDDDIHLLLYPDDSDINLYASVGEVARGNAKTVPVRSGIATFNGSAISSLPRRPSGSNPEFQVLFAFNAKGEPISISLNYNCLTNILSANEECTAAVRYSHYVSASRKLIYRPKKTKLAVGLSVELGVIAAFKAPDNLLIYEVQPFTGGGTEAVEVYRIVSEAVTTPDGEFEKPPNYPNDGEYPDFPTFTLDISASLLTERVHEIGYMQPSGFVEVKEYFLSNLPPFFASDLYKPAKILKPSALPEDRFDKSVILRAKDFIASRGRGKL